MRLPAGKYYIGDPCYVIENHDEWLAILKQCDYFEPEGEHTVRGAKCCIGGTAYGDGRYLDNQGNEYGVDAGLLSVMPVEICDNKLDLTRLGSVIEFSEPFEATAENGIFIFGKIIIDTRNEDEQDEDYDDDYEDENYEDEEDQDQ